jgi:hypothetical protein
MDFVLNHWVDLLAIVTSTITAASIIAKLTPNTHDDAVMQKILTVIQWLSINGGPKK